MYIKRVERNKRKFVTAVSGLEAHGMDLKKVAKDFGKKCESVSCIFWWEMGIGEGRFGGLCGANVACSRYGK